jgi:predicted hydrocarbon binding protein
VINLGRSGQEFGPMMKVMENTIGDLSSAFYKKYGKDALPTIAAVSAKSGAEYAKIAQKMMPFKSMKDIGEMYKMMTATSGERMEIVRLSDDVLHFKMSRCLYGIEGTSQELCEAMMNSDKIISTLLGEQVNVKAAKSMAGGDKYCEVIYSKK